MAKPKRLVDAAIDELSLPPEIVSVLQAISREVDAAYRDRFLEMAEALRRQSSALDRIQGTLELLVKHADPNLANAIPALRLAQPGEAPDVDVATVAVDPIGAGYALSQSDLAKALSWTQADVSILVRAFRLPNDPRCAMVVRKGANTSMVNYHRHAVEKLREMVAAPPPNLSAEAKQAVKRVKRRAQLG